MNGYRERKRLRRINSSRSGTFLSFLSAIQIKHPIREYLPLFFALSVDKLPIGNMNIQTTKQIGTAIRAKRKALKVTQKDLAMTCGTGLRFISELEQGKPTCQIGKVLQVVQALGLNVRIADPTDEPGQGHGS